MGQLRKEVFPLVKRALNKHAIMNFLSAVPWQMKLQTHIETRGMTLQRETKLCCRRWLQQTQNSVMAASGCGVLANGRGTRPGPHSSVAGRSTPHHGSGNPSGTVEKGWTWRFVCRAGAVRERRDVLTTLGHGSWLAQRTDGACSRYSLAPQGRSSLHLLASDIASGCGLACGPGGWKNDVRTMCHFCHCPFGLSSQSLDASSNRYSEIRH